MEEVIVTSEHSGEANIAIACGQIVAARGDVFVRGIELAREKIPLDVGDRLVLADSYVSDDQYLHLRFVRRAAYAGL